MYALKQRGIILCRGNLFECMGYLRKLWSDRATVKCVVDNHWHIDKI